MCCFTKHWSNFLHDLGLSNCIRASPPISTKKVSLNSLWKNWFTGWHPSHQRQLVHYSPKTNPYKSWGFTLSLRTLPLRQKRCSNEVSHVWKRLAFGGSIVEIKSISRYCCLHMHTQPDSPSVYNYFLTWKLCNNSNWCLVSRLSLRTKSYPSAVSLTQNKLLAIWE
jgi:hypothetical protein